MSRIITKPVDVSVSPAIIIDTAGRMNISDKIVQKPKEFVYVPPKDSGAAPAYHHMLKPRLSLGQFR
jgi:signal recognition particle GTPase